MRYCIMIDEKLKIAVDKSNELNKMLENEAKLENGMISTKRILHMVQHCTKTRIGVAYLPFSKALGKSSNYGAMMSVYNEDEQQVADIIVNSDMDAEYQRFSLIHELGHLMTGKYNVEEKSKGYKISAHINQDVFSIPKEEYDRDVSLLNEQIANVFALRVLIPFNELMKRIDSNGNLNEIAKSFGVTRDAIISRIVLGM